MSILLLILGLALFLGLVVAHEWGHFIVARKGGVEVEEFGIGFPPRLMKKKMKGGWFFTVNLLPLGGFVKLKGEHDTDSAPGSLGAATVRTKAAIMVAGVAVNLLAAYVLLTLLALIGMPKLIDNQFTIASDARYMQHAHTFIAADTVESGSPASTANIHPDDILLSIGTVGALRTITSTSELPKLTQLYAGKTVTIVYKHTENGPSLSKQVTLRSAPEIAAAKAAGKQMGYLGLSVYQGQNGIDVVRSTWSAPIVAAGVIKQFTILTFQGLGKAIAGLGGIVAGSVTGNTTARQAGQAEASSQVAGPVGIFFVFKYGSMLGYRFILLIVAILSLTLAIMNILPLPALDGGRLWLMLITRMIKRPLSPHREEIINTTGFAILMGLVVLVTIADVKRFF